MEAHEIVKQIHDAFPKSPAKVARIIGKCDELIKSHHREPKSRNPLSSGNCSPVTHYMEYVHQNEAAERGAGRMMNNRVHASLAADFDEDDGLSHAEHSGQIIKEGCDVHTWLAQHNLETATVRELETFELDANQEIDALQRAIVMARARKRLLGATSMNGGGQR